MSYSNPLFDIDFLYKLSTAKQREIFARITSLTWEEMPLEYIEGKVTGGSINVDGSSAVRRTCNLTLIAKGVNINDFYWGLHTKFKLEIGLRNKINPHYPDIIWFKQGLFIITSFNTSASANNYTINISGKDKMCLLNGDIAGSLPHTTDFGIEEYYDSTTGITTYTSIPIKNIIRESVQNFGNELAKNIIINDIEDAGLELLEYRGDIPLYLFREVDSDVFTNMTLNANQPCYINGKQTTIGNSKDITYDDLVNLDEDSSIASIVQLSNEEGAKQYKIAKFEYGSIPGYRLTDLTYAGDLIGEVGSTLTQMLDKIKQMLGYYEYFYDIDGKFIFQKKKDYIETSWNSSSESGDEIIANAAINSNLTFNFVGSNLISAISNTPNLLNVRNDYSVWGKKKTTSGSELDIHMRYAIDKKPHYYKTYDGRIYTTDKSIFDNLHNSNNVYYVDWREIIYQMALDYRKHYHDDDFLYQVERNNLFGEKNLYINGKTGYEQYYIDLEGFWRLLYDLEPELNITPINYEDINTTDLLHIQYPYHKVSEEDLVNVNLEDLYVIYQGQICPFIEGYCHLAEGTTYFYKTTEGKMNQGTSSSIILNNVDLRELYIKNVETFQDKNGQAFKDKNGNELQVYQYAVDSEYNDFVRHIDACFDRIDKDLLYIRNVEYMPFSELDDTIKSFYYKNGTYQETISKYTKIDNYGNITDATLIPEKIIYCNGYYNYNVEPETANYWSKAVSNSPEGLLFWFDFLDAEGSDIARYSVPMIGSRSKAVKDTNVKSIYYREIPTTIFQNGEETYEHQTGYTYIQLQNTMENLFTISSKGISAKERVEEFLYDYACRTASINITSLPVYYLNPNSRIRVYDKNSNIDGEYIVNKFTIPLTHNGTMNITATKVVEDII